MGGLQGQVPGQENSPGAATASAVSSGADEAGVTLDGDESPAAADEARDAGLTTLVGREDWWNSRLPLHQFEQQRITQAIATVWRAKGPSVQPGHVIAEFSFGFWTGLLANRYHERLWVPALHRAFSHLVGPRRELHRKQESLRKLRNRIAHHEPVFARNLAADHDRLLSIFDAISPTAVDWVKQNFRVPHILARRELAVAGTESTTF